MGGANYSAHRRHHDREILFGRQRRDQQQGHCAESPSFHLVNRKQHERHAQTDRTESLEVDGNVEVMQGEVVVGIMTMMVI